MDIKDLRNFLSVVIGISISKLTDYVIKAFNINIPFFLNLILTGVILIIVFIIINLMEKRIINRKMRYDDKKK